MSEYTVGRVTDEVLNLACAAYNKAMRDAGYDDSQDDGLSYASPMALRAALAAQEQGDAVAWRIDTDDDVERVAKSVGWDNRRYMTPADYAIWCSRMREFVRLAAGHAAPPATPAGVPDVVSEVMAELEEAIRKFPTWPTDPLHAVGVFNEEAGELSKAVLQQVYEPHKNAADDVRKEARQAAAMALRFLVSIDSYDWTPGTQHEQPSLAAPSATKGDGGAE